MNKTFSVGLLLWAVFLQAEGHGSYANQPKAIHSNESCEIATKHLVSSQLQCVLDTTRPGSQRLAPMPPALASAYSSVSHRSMAAPPAQPTTASEAALGEETTFDPATADLPTSLAVTLSRPTAPLGRRTYRTRLVRTGRWATSREAVEILTCTYAGPLVLAQLPATATTPAQLLAGPGYDATTPLRPLELTPASVLRLCGDRAPQVQAYARLYNLHFQQAEEVARLLDYYNRIAVIKE